MSGQVWATDSLGGYMHSDNLSKVLRHSLQPLVQFRQFADVKDASLGGLSKGSQFHWNVYSDVATAGAALTESAAMPETNFTITQGTLTITEYGNSVPFTEKLDNLSEHSVKEVINKVLKNDAKKVLDSAAHEQFDDTKVYFAPSSGSSTTAITVTTNGATATTNNVAFGKGHAKAIVDEMKERGVPAYEGNDYFAVGRPSAFRNVKNELEDVHKYVDQGFTMIMNGEIGRYEGTRYVEQTNVASEGWTNAKSDAIYFFGDDTVAEAVAVPEEIRGKLPTDYGRSKGIAWYYLGGFGIVHTEAAQARIFKWASAA